MDPFPLDLTKLQAQLASATGRGVRVAVLDSGIDFSHPALARLKIAEDLVIEGDGPRPRTTDGEGVGVFGHGTAVAGIIHRLAPEAEIASIRVLGAFKQSHAQIIQEGVKQAARRGYHVLQCSFGAPARPADAARYKGWLDACYRQKRHVVAASANGLFTKAEWPAHFPHVIAVGAAEAAERSQSVESGPNPLPTLTQVSGTLVELLAQGEEPAALWPGGETRQLIGSSFAAPRVTGILCRLLECYPDLHPLQAKATLLSLAQQEVSV